MVKMSKERVNDGKPHWFDGSDTPILNCHHHQENKLIVDRLEVAMTAFPPFLAVKVENSMEERCLDIAGFSALRCENTRRLPPQLDRSQR